MRQKSRRIWWIGLVSVACISLFGCDDAGDNPELHGVLMLDLQPVRQESGSVSARGVESDLSLLDCVGDSGDNTALREVMVFDMKGGRGLPKGAKLISATLVLDMTKQAASEANPDPASLSPFGAPFVLGNFQIVELGRDLPRPINGTDLDRRSESGATLSADDFDSPPDSVLYDAPTADVPSAIDVTEAAATGLAGGNTSLKLRLQFAIASNNDGRPQMALFPASQARLQVVYHHQASDHLLVTWPNWKVTGDITPSPSGPATLTGAGCRATGGESPVRGFMTFDLGLLPPGAEVVYGTLNLGHYENVSATLFDIAAIDPETGFPTAAYSFGVYAQKYGSLAAGDYDATVDATLYHRADGGTAVEDIDATAALRSILVPGDSPVGRRGATRLQIRMQFDGASTHGVVWHYGDSHGSEGPARLTVSYQ